MAWTIFIIVVLLVGIAFVGLGVSTFFSKKKRFPEIHIGRNKAMQERGISCAITTDFRERQAYKPMEKLDTEGQA